MNKETEKIFINYCDSHLSFSNKYADSLTEAAKDDAYSLIKSEYQKDLKDVVKRERERLRRINTLYKMKCRADRKILRLRKAGVEYEPQPTVAQQVRAALDAYFSEMFVNQQQEPVEEPQSVNEQGADIELPEDVETSESLQEAQTDEEVPDASEDESPGDFIKRMGIR